jgi:hypothetical protein
VRIAVYTQAFLALVPAFQIAWNKPFALALPSEGERLSAKELKSLTSKCLTVYLTGCALLLSAFLQASKHQLTVYHALIVLMLSWLNNITAFLPHFILRIATDKSERPGLRNITGNIGGTVMTVAGLCHFSAMAALGIWVVQTLPNFDRSQAACANSTLFYVMGYDILVADPVFLVVAMIIFCLAAVPLLNVFLLDLYLKTTNFAVTLIFFSIISPAIIFFVRNRKLSAPAFVFLHDMSIWPLPVALFVDILLIIATESIIKRNTVASDGGIWSFGQTLALLLLAFPIMQTWKEGRKLWQLREARSITAYNETAYDFIQREISERWPSSEVMNGCMVLVFAIIRSFELRRRSRKPMHGVVNGLSMRG